MSKISLGLTSRGWAQIIKSGLNRFQNRQFGLNIGPEAWQDPCGALWASPAAKKKKSIWPSRPRTFNVDPVLVESVTEALAESVDTVCPRNAVWTWGRAFKC